MPRLRTMAAILLAGYLLTGVAEVRPDERAVVRRFGAVAARPGPGLWVGLPWGIDRIDRVSLRPRQLAVGYDPDAADDSEGLYLTGDQNLIHARLILEYAPDPADGRLEQYVLHRGEVELLLRRHAAALAGAWAAARPVDDALLAGRAGLAAYVLARLPSRLAGHPIGVIVSRVSVELLAPPPEVKDAFDAVTQAQSAVQTRVTQAMQEADRRKNEAAAEAFKLGQQAAAYRDGQRSAAAADAAAFAARLAEYRKAAAKNPDALAAIWWDELGRVFVGMRTRGRVEPLDAHLGPNGLDITQVLPPKK